MLKVIAFDFDGTLADSVDFCLAVFNKVFAEFMGDKAPEQEEIYQNFGMNEPGVIRFFMGEENREAEEYFYKLHREMHPEICPAPYPGIISMLNFLKSKNIRLGILTGRSETTCHISLDCLKMNEYFDFFYYGSPDKNDKAAQLLDIIEKNNLRHDEIAYVGDAVSDVLACQKADVKCFVAAWAKSARIAELEKLNPDLVFRSVPDMQKAIEQHLQ